MMHHPRLLRPVRAAFLAAVGLSAATLSAPLAASASAQQPAVRLPSSITGEAKTVLPGSRPPRALPANDLGLLPADTAIHGITLVFKRTDAQETALQALLAAQTNPASPQFHQWLTPSQFAATYGVADADLATVENWLQSKGFTDISVASSRDRITFSGSAAQVGAAFATEMHQYRAEADTGANGAAPKANFAPGTDLSLPAVLAPVVLSVEHLSTFRPRPQVRTLSTKPDYTSSSSGSHFLTPGDIATQYNVKPVYNSGFNGAGQTIVVASQSYIQLSDVQHFQTAAGLPNNLPTLFLLPNSGASAAYQSDEAESDLDVEYALGTAPGAQVIMIYAGDYPNIGAFDAVTYAVQHNVAPIISLSYGACELDISPSGLNTYNALAQQANVQGQTILTAAGDSGSTTCFGDTDLTLAQQETPSVDFIADLPNVTGIGGLQLQAGTYDNGTQYFAAANGADNISSLLSYVPETVWNEDVAAGSPFAGGGGSSATVPRPSWQTGVPGIPAGAYRLVPDLSFQASTGSPGFLFCSSDPSAWNTRTNQSSSCTNGFRDAATSTLTIAGGTSFATPIFAGMLAVLNQAKHVAAQGNINPTLYSLAANPATYASAFHDITSGTNACTVANGNVCSAAGAAGYAAGVGYDEASGLGSVNFANLVVAWPSSTAPVLAASTTTLAAATLTPASGATDAITISVTSTTAGTPTGSVAISVDGGAAITVPLTNGHANFTYPSSTVGGSHLVSATYSGDMTFAASVGTVTLTLAGTSIPAGSFTLAVGSITVPAGNVGTSTVTLTPAGGYNGSVNFTVTGTYPSTLCYAIKPVGSNVLPPIPAYTLTFAPVGSSVCQGLFRSATGTAQGAKAAGTTAPRSPWNREPWNREPWNREPWNREGTGTVLAGLFLVGLVARKRARTLPSMLAVGALGTLGLVASLGLGGCGSSTAVTPPSTGAATGTYTLTLVGTDSVTSTITSSATFTLTVQ